MNKDLKKLDIAITAAIGEYITVMESEPVELICLLIDALACAALTFAKKDKRENPIEMAKSLGMAVTLQTLKMAIGLKTDAKTQAALAELESKGG